MLLTKALVDGAKPEGKMYRLWDTKVPGLVLRVWPSGVRAWYVQWGRNKARSIGRPPAVGLELARTRALAVLNDAAANGTPQVAHKRKTATTLREFLTDVFRPWAQLEFKSGNGDMAADRIESVYADLLDTRLSDITVKSVNDINMARRRKSTRRESGVSKSTMTRDLAELKAALEKAVTWEHISENPLAELKLPRLKSLKVVRYLGVDEEKRLRAAMQARDAELRAARESHRRWQRERGHAEVAAIPDDGFGDHLTPMVLVALNTGLRRGEQTQMLWSDIDRGVITVRPEVSKTELARHIPLSPEAAGALRRWRAQTGGANSDRVFQITDPKKAWKSLLQSAKIVKFRWHDLRHTFASCLAMAGIDLNTIRDLMGHTKIETTLIYAHLCPGHRADAIRALMKPRKESPAHIDEAPALPAPEPPPNPAAAAEDLASQISDPAELRALVARLVAKLEG